MKKFTLILIILASFLCEIEAQILEVPYTGTDVTVSVSGSIYYPNINPAHDDHIYGVVVLYISNEQDGSATIGKILQGTHYYKPDPDVFEFTSNPNATSIYIFALDLYEHEGSEGPLEGLYIVNVNGEDVTLETSNVVYLLPCNEIGTVFINSFSQAEKTILQQNYPNPFLNNTTITFFIEHFDMVKLDVFNNEGQLVKTLVNEKMIEGEHNIIWNGDDNNNNPLPTGMYIYKITVGNLTQSKNTILLR